MLSKHLKLGLLSPVSSGRMSRWYVCVADTIYPSLGGRQEERSDRALRDMCPSSS